MSISLKVLAIGGSCCGVGDGGGVGSFAGGGDTCCVASIGCSVGAIGSVCCASGIVVKSGISATCSSNCGMGCINGVCVEGFDQGRTIMGGVVYLLLHGLMHGCTIQCLASAWCASIAKLCMHHEIAGLGCPLISMIGFDQGM
jgi:hypothetical protein